MKIKETYVCEYCGKESTHKEEIEICEAVHSKLTREERIYYETLKWDAESSMGRFLDTKGDPIMISAYERAAKKLYEFEKLHGILN